MEVHIASPLIHLSTYGMAPSMCRCVTDALTRTRSNRETGCSSINSLGMKPFVSIAGHRPICLSPAIVGRGNSRVGGP
jgi:hypothetical protein